MLFGLLSGSLFEAFLDYFRSLLAFFILFLSFWLFSGPFSLLFLPFWPFSGPFLLCCLWLFFGFFLEFLLLAFCAFAPLSLFTIILALVLVVVSLITL